MKLQNIQIICRHQYYRGNQPLEPLVAQFIKNQQKDQEIRKKKHDRKITAEDKKDLKGKRRGFGFLPR